MVGGFQTKAEFENNVVVALQPWFTGAGGNYSAYSIGTGTTTFTSAGHSIQVDDEMTILSETGTSIEFTFASVTAITTNTFTVDQEAGAPDVSNTGQWFVYDNIVWTDSTPGGGLGSEPFLREIHIQFSTSSSAIIEVTLDGGQNWLPLNNNAGIFGLATFTMFVKFNTELNFRSTSTTTVSITVTGD